MSSVNTKKKLLCQCHQIDLLLHQKIYIQKRNDIYQVLNDEAMEEDRRVIKVICSDTGVFVLL